MANERMLNEIFNRVLFLEAKLGEVKMVCEEIDSLIELEFENSQDLDYRSSRYANRYSINCTEWHDRNNGMHYIKKYADETLKYIRERLENQNKSVSTFRGRSVKVDDVTF